MNDVRLQVLCAHTGVPDQYVYYGHTADNHCTLFRYRACYFDWPSCDSSIFLQVDQHAKLCGEKSANATEPPYDVSNSDVVIMHFHSDESNTYKGLKLHFRFSWKNLATKDKLQFLLGLKFLFVPYASSIFWFTWAFCKVH